MKLFIISFYNKDKDFDHATAIGDEGDAMSYWNLVKETRSKEKIPHMEMHVVTLGEPVYIHTKE